MPGSSSVLQSFSHSFVTVSCLNFIFSAYRFHVNSLIIHVRPGKVYDSYAACS